MTVELTRDERLERWARVLEAVPDGGLSPFQEVEFMSSAACLALRQARSPLAAAFGDPVLRGAGLGSDRYGDGIEFFGLSYAQAHRILCSCGYLGTMRGTDVARRVRTVAQRRRRRASWAANPLPAFARWLAGWRPATT